MTSIIPALRPKAPGGLLAMPPEIRQHIFRLCIPENFCFDCSSVLKLENRPSQHRSAVIDLETRGYTVGIDYPDSDTAPSTGRDLPDADEEEDYQPCELDDYRYGVHSDLAPDLESGPSALPGLLLVCRQITDEVQPLLYGDNIFMFNDNYNGEYYLSTNFSIRTRKLIRKMILILPLWNTGFHLRPCVWDDTLSNLVVLGIVIQKPIDQPDVVDSAWAIWANSILKHLEQVLPKTAKIVVDANKEEAMVQMVESELPGRCVFQRLRAGDKILRPNAELYSGYEYDDDGPTSCRDIIDDCDYHLYYSD